MSRVIFCSQCNGKVSGRDDMKQCRRCGSLVYNRIPDTFTKVKIGRNPKSSSRVGAEIFDILEEASPRGEFIDVMANKVGVAEGTISTAIWELNNNMKAKSLRIVNVNENERDSIPCYILEAWTGIYGWQPISEVK